nr:unnamed protein product [Callosobruchus chinensis]
MLNCSICKKTFKNSCVDISSAEVRLLNSNKGCDWSCRSCRAFGNEMKDLKALILKLQEDIQVLKSGAVAVNSPNQDDFLEEIITEVEERSKRRKNLVIFGIPEQDQSLSNNDQVSRDVTNTVEILRVMNRDIDSQAIKHSVVDELSGGGVLLALKSQIRSVVIDVSTLDASFPLIDTLLCNCSIGYNTFYVGIIYIPPSITADEYESFFEELEQTFCLHSNPLILLGDFNAPNFRLGINQDRKTNAINSLLSVLNLHQHNNVVNETGRLLDLVISNQCCSVTRDHIPLVPEDRQYHPALIIFFSNIAPKINSFPQTLDSNAYNFRKANFPLLYDALIFVDWSFLDCIGDVNEALEAFYSCIHNIFDLYIPKYRVFSHKYTPWFTSDIIKLVKCKAKVWKKFKKYGSESALDEFKSLRSNIKIKISHAYTEYLMRVQTSITQNPQYFWTFVHSRNKTSRIPSSMKLENIALTSPTDIGNGFAQFFESVFVILLMIMAVYANQHLMSMFISKISLNRKYWLLVES